MIRYTYRNRWVRTLVGWYDTIGSLLLRTHPKTPQEPRRISLIIPHQIGDLAMATPTIAGIYAMAPNAKITVIAGSLPGTLLKPNPWNVDVITFDAAWQRVSRQFSDKKLGILGSIRQFLRLMRQLRPDVVVTFQPDLVLNHLLFWLRPPVSIGFNNAGGGFLLTHPVEQPATKHETEVLYELAARFANIFHQQLPKQIHPELTIEQMAKLEVNKRLLEAKILPQRLVVIHPFPSSQPKNWLPDRWEKLSDWLVKEGWQPIIIGGKTDTLPRLPHGVVSWAGKLPLGETLALLAAARFCIMVDSGPAHMAAAIGTPIISIFSSVNDPERWQPRGKLVKLLHAPVTDRKKYPLESKQLAPDIQGNPYSEGITLQMVTDAVTEIAGKP